MYDKIHTASLLNDFLSEEEGYCFLEFSYSAGVLKDVL